MKNNGWRNEQIGEGMKRMSEGMKQTSEAMKQIGTHTALDFTKITTRKNLKQHNTMQKINLSVL